MSRQRQMIQDLRSLGQDPAQIALAGFLDERHEGLDDADLWLVVLLQQALAEGHVCLERARIDERLQRLFADAPLTPPDVESLLRQFDQSPLIAEAGMVADCPRPLVREDGRLYFHRYWRNEQRIATRLMALLDRDGETADGEDMDQAALDALFPSGQTKGTDYQKLAAIVALRHRLAIVSGGPGTGKTWAVSRVLALALKREPSLRIALAAPTGKAAARLSQAIDESRPELGLDEALQQRIPDKAVTLHRLLGIHPMTHRPRHDAQNPLALDLLVLDEASMIDQNLMTQVCDALPDSARLILLGDKDQLSSVEAGNVFADLCGGLSRSEAGDGQRQWLQRTFAIDLPPHQGDYRLVDQVVVLQHSRRFDPDSGIGRLARLINEGDADGCLSLLRAAGEDEQLRWLALAPDEAPDYRALAEPVYLEMIRAGDVEQAFDAFGRFQLLAGVWKGPLGVDHINEEIEQTIRRRAGIVAGGEYFHGKPLMMTSNVYQYGIHNGDIGIVWRDERHGELRLCVQTAEGYRFLALSQLPRHHGAYAMTIHKSQGSEFDEVVIVLPDADSPLMTRELLYTAVTRARKRVEIRGSEAALRAAVTRRTERMSGLRQRLTGANGLR
jgi:exodeoxyribonuclease V alpha subunit